MIEIIRNLNLNSNRSPIINNLNRTLVYIYTIYIRVLAILYVIQTDSRSYELEQLAFSDPIRIRIEFRYNTRTHFATYISLSMFGLVSILFGNAPVRSSVRKDDPA